MLRKTLSVHAPALTRQEAAMLPALVPALPDNLLIPYGALDFRSGRLDSETVGKAGAPTRRGSMAGRAALAHVLGRDVQRGRQRTKSWVAYT